MSFIFDWAQHRRTKGAVKLHLLLDHQGLLPSYALVTEGRVHESRVAHTLRFEAGTIVVFDRGFTDYHWFASLDADGVYFVTRMKDNADYGVLERRPVPVHSPVRRDEIISLQAGPRRRTRSVQLDSTMATSTRETQLNAENAHIFLNSARRFRLIGTALR